MQSRREFFNRLAVLCGAAAVVPVAAKALNVENLSAAIAQVARERYVCDVLYFHGFTAVLDCPDFEDHAVFERVRLRMAEAERQSHETACRFIFGIDGRFGVASNGVGL